MIIPEGNVMIRNLAGVASALNRKTATEFQSLDQYMGELEKFPRLTREDEVALAQGIREGDLDALHQLVQANLLFVVSVAQEYQNKGLPLNDLINEGNTGLIEGARRFDGTRGIRFISYAVWWIRQAIRQAFADHVRMIRLPRLQVEKLDRLKERIRTQEQTTSKSVNVQEAITDIESGRSASQPLHRLLHVNAVPSSLDVTEDGQDNCLMDRIPDTQHVLPDEEATDGQMKEEVHRTVNYLPPREAHVLKQYYGLDGDDPCTLEEIGHSLGLSRERVRQLKERGLQRLRHRSVSVRLHALL